MSGGGSMASMNISLKNNRVQSSRRKQRVKNVRDYYRDAVVQRKKFIGKEVSQEELNQIKTKIREEAKRRHIRHFIIKISVLIVLIGLSTILMIKII